MDAFILCAGFGTRMREITNTIPKPLLRLSGRSFIGHITTQLIKCEDIETVHVVVNNKDATKFYRWATTWKQRLKSHNVELHVHDDGVRSPDEQLGPLGDLRFVLGKLGTFPASGGLVCAADSFYRFPLAPILDAFSGQVSRVPALYEPDLGTLCQRSVLRLDDQKVKRVFECPEDPPSKRVCPSMYMYNASALSEVDPYLRDGNDPDSLGLFADHIARTKRLEGVLLPKVPGLRIHCNTPKHLRKARKKLKGRENMIISEEELFLRCRDCK